MTLSCRVNKTAVLYILSVSSLYCIIKVIHVVNINYIPKELPNTWRVYNSSYQQRNTIRPVSCQKLILDDSAEQNKAFDYMLHNKPVPKTDDYYIKITSDCANFYRTMGYVMEPLSSEEADFSIAFSILMYRDVEQTERLLRAIYRPQNIYCVHVDVKAEYGVYENMKAIAQCLPNVFLVSKRESVVYASYKRLQAEINCMADLVNFFSHWKYFINLASQSFPTKTMEEIVNILKIYNGANDVEGILEPRIHKSRFEWKWNIVEKSGKYELEKSEVRKQPPPHNIKIVRGSAYGIFSRGFVEYVIHDPVAKDLLEWSKDTYSPDEHYWATLYHLKENPHLKTPGGYKGQADKKPWLAVYASWGGQDPCHSKHWVRGVCIFGVADLPQLTQRHELFVNKFHQDYQPLAMDCMEEWLYNRSYQHPEFDYSYYKNLPFIIP